MLHTLGLAGNFHYEREIYIFFTNNCLIENAKEFCGNQTAES